MVSISIKDDELPWNDENDFDMSLNNRLEILYMSESASNENVAIKLDFPHLYVICKKTKTLLKNKIRIIEQKETKLLRVDDGGNKVTE